MRELRDILDAFRRLVLRGECGVLASVVRTAGSTYRKVGARMLMLHGGERIGVLSGGCLEADLAGRADRVRSSDHAQLVRYDTTSEDDVLWGHGLGCAGRVEVLLEPVDAARPGPLAWLAAWRRTRGVGAIATSLAEHDLGRRLALHPDGRLEAWPHGAIDPALAALLHDLRRGRSLPEDRHAAGDLALEIAAPPTRLVVFGAEADAAPVLRLAHELGWHTVVVDGRSAALVPDRFPGAELVTARAEGAVAAAAIDAATCAIVMTHRYLDDREIVADLLQSATPYIGLLGPRARADDLLADLARRGRAGSAEQRRRLFAPAGLDLGAAEPTAIALALVAEVQARVAGRSGGWLRDRKGPLHGPAGR